jgi:hypothetical protein
MRDNNYFFELKKWKLELQVIIIFLMTITATYKKINKTKNLFFEKIGKINKPLENLPKIRREKTEINKIRNEKLGMTNTKTIQGIIRNYFENLYSNKLETLEIIDKLIDTYDHLKLNQEDINHLNRYITYKEIEAEIQSIPPKKSRT